MDGVHSLVTTLRTIGQRTIVVLNEEYQIQEDNDRRFRAIGARSSSSAGPSGSARVGLLSSVGPSSLARYAHIASVAVSPSTSNLLISSSGAAIDSPSIDDYTVITEPAEWSPLHFMSQSRFLAVGGWFASLGVAGFTAIALRKMVKTEMMLSEPMPKPSSFSPLELWSWSRIFLASFVIALRYPTVLGTSARTCLPFLLTSTMLGYVVGSGARGLGTTTLSAKEPEALPFCAIVYGLTGIFGSLFCAVAAVRQSLLAVIG